MRVRGVMYVCVCVCVERALDGECGADEVGVGVWPASRVAGIAYGTISAICPP